MSHGFIGHDIWTEVQEYMVTALQQVEAGVVTHVAAYLKLVHQDEDIDLVIETRHSSHDIQELLWG